MANRFSGLVCFLCSHVLGIRLCTPDPASWSKGICIRWCKNKIEAFYHSLDQFNFKEKNNKIILKIVLFNFAILLVICSFWYYGIAGLIIYSVILFLILQKYFNDLRKKYALLLEATNKIADGNLDVEIEGDLGWYEHYYL